MTTINRITIEALRRFWGVRDQNEVWTGNDIGGIAPESRTSCTASAARWALATPTRSECGASAV